MSLDRIPEDRLFQNNTKEEIIGWVKQLKYFHYMRSRGGHNCEGDSFCVYFKYSDKSDLTAKLNKLGITLDKLQEGDIAFDPLESYSFEDLDKLKIVIAHFGDLVQPQNTHIDNYNVHVWVLPNSFEISVSGTKENNAYKVSEEDFQICLYLESLFDKLGWSGLQNEDIKKYPHCISEEIYPELFE